MAGLMEYVMPSWQNVEVNPQPLKELKNFGKIYDADVPATQVRNNENNVN